MIKFVKNGTICSLPHTDGKDRYSGYTISLLAHIEGVTPLYTPAVEPTETRVVALNSNETKGYKYNSNNPTIGFQKGSTSFVCCNEEVASIEYNDPSLASITLGALSYGSWSVWSDWYYNGSKWIRDRRRSFRFNLQAIITDSGNKTINYPSYVSTLKVFADYGSHIQTFALNEEIAGTYISNWTVSGYGKDAGVITVRIYNASGTYAGETSVQYPIDGYQYEQET